MSTISKPSAMIGNVLDQANIRIPGNISTAQPGKTKSIGGRAKRHTDDVDGIRQNVNDDVSLAPTDGAVDVAEFQDGMMLAQADTRSIGEGVAVGVAVASDGSAAIAATEVASQGVTGTMIGGGLAAIGGIAAVSGGGGGDSAPLAPTPTVTHIGNDKLAAAAAAAAALDAATASAQANAAEAAALKATALADVAAAQAAKDDALLAAAHAKELGEFTIKALAALAIAETVALSIHEAPAVAAAAQNAEAAAIAFAASHPGDAAAAAAAAAATAASDVADAAVATIVETHADVAADITVVVFGGIAATAGAETIAAVGDAKAAEADALAAGQHAQESADAAAAAALAASAGLTDVAELTASSTAAITVQDFDAAPLASGGDIIDMSAIASLTDSVATSLTLGSDFQANNLFIFDGTAVSIDAAASAIAADDSVVATQGYIVIRDSGNADAVTVYHSADLQGNGADTALVILSGVNIANLTAANFVV